MPKYGIIGGFMKKTENSNRIRFNKNIAGFTLLELMIALVILSIGILGIATMQTSSVGGNSAAKATTEGSTWAMDRIERLMNLPYDHLDLTVGAHPPEPSPDGVYTINWTVTEPYIVPKTKHISVTVTWQWGLARYKSVTIEKILPQIT